MKKENVKSYLMPNMEKRTTLEIRKDRENNQIIIKISLDGQLMFNVWCEHISVFLTKPPTYCLYFGDTNFLGLSAKHITVHPDALLALGKEATEALGKYITIEAEKK